MAALAILRPTAEGIRVNTTQEAGCIVDHTRDGSAPELGNRIGREGPSIIRPGMVFVYQANGRSGITRWTDGLKGYSGSTNRQGFLCYVLPHPPTGGPAWVRKTWNCTFTAPDGREDTWHFVAYDYNDESYGKDLGSVDDLLSLPRPDTPATLFMGLSQTDSPIDLDETETVVCSPVCSLFSSSDVHKIRDTRVTPYRRRSRRSTSPCYQQRSVRTRLYTDISLPDFILQRRTPTVELASSTRRLPPEPSSQECSDSRTVTHVFRS